MEGFREGFTSFWETLTGVLDDDRSKIIRMFSILVLFSGIIWAGVNYFRAERIANLNENMENSSYSALENQSSETFNKLTEIAQTVGNMRRGGEAIANSLSSMNNMPFNIAGYNVLGLEDLSTAFENPENASNDMFQLENQHPQITVKALMLSGRNKYAVVDYADKKGNILRQGQKLPDGEGCVIKINQEGITVMLNDKEVVYTVK